MVRALLLSITCCILFAATSGFSISEPTSSYISYQGVLGSNGGTITSGNYDMGFCIYRYETGGSSLWGDTLSVAVNGDGGFTVTLGPIPSTIFFDPALPDESSTKWLEIQVIPDPPMSPRSQVTATPYSSVTSRVAGDIRTRPGSISLVDTTGDTMQTNEFSATNSVSNLSLASRSVATSAIRAEAKVMVNPFGSRLTLSQPSLQQPVLELLSDEEEGPQMKFYEGSVGDLVAKFEKFRMDYYRPTWWTSDPVGTCSYSMWGMALVDTTGDTMFAAMANTGTGEADVRVTGKIMAGGFELPAGAHDGYVLVSDEIGVGTWQPISGGSGQWVLSGDILSTAVRAGLRRGGYGAVMLGDSTFSMINFGSNCTTGVAGDNVMHATILSGEGNVAARERTFIGGGLNNHALGHNSFIGGGRSNTTNDTGAVIIAGYYNYAGGKNSAIVSGRFDSTYARFGAALSGYLNKGGDDVDDTAAIVAGGYVNTAAASYATVAGGLSNTASGWASIAAGGSDNSAGGTQSTVSGGYWNQATGDRSVVSGGAQNLASGSNSCVGGGVSNQATADMSTLGGGAFNINGGYYAGVLGGFKNSTSGSYSVILGGLEDTLTSGATLSMAFGNEVYLSHAYRVAFFDGTTSGGLGVNRDDRDGGISYPIHIGTNVFNGNGARLTAGGTWTNGSSSEFKEGFTAVDASSVLQRIRQLSVPSWYYKSTTERHIGPMAEDFVAAFDVGTTDEDGSRENQYLAASDVAGVALVGVQELAAQLDQKDEEIKALRQQVEELKKMVESLASVSPNKK